MPTIVNKSANDMRVKVDTSNNDQGDSGEWTIAAGTSDFWRRNHKQVARINALSQWHDFHVEPNATITLGSDFIFRIVDGSNRYEWDARASGPHL